MEELPVKLQDSFRSGWMGFSLGKAEEASNTMVKVDFDGKYYTLPLKGSVVVGYFFKGLPQFYLDDPEEAFFDLMGPFEFTLESRTESVDPSSFRAVEILHQLLHKPIVLARANRFGVLEIDFGNAGHILVPDGPNENWHFTWINYNHVKGSIYMHGGAGATAV